MKKALISFTAVVVTAALCTISASTRTLPIRQPAVNDTARIARHTSSSVTSAQLRQAAHQVAELRRLTWHCQDVLGTTRTKASVDIWSLPASVGYRIWVAKKWVKVAKSCQTVLQLRTIPSTGDWNTAVRLVQRIYPGTADWLTFISNREGGNGRFVMNTQGSGAGGWMQFMYSTFDAHNDDAYADVARRGFIVNPATNQWTHPLGQAITAAFMRYTNIDGCHWCP